MHGMNSHENKLMTDPSIHSSVHLKTKLIISYIYNSIQCPTFIHSFQTTLHTNSILKSHATFYIARQQTQSLLSSFTYYHNIFINNINQYCYLILHYHFIKFQNTSKLVLLFKYLFHMKTSSHVNLDKYIQNTNKEIIKNNDNLHSALLQLDCLLGIDNIGSPSILYLNDEQILYYSCKNFVFYNLSTKQYKIVNKQVKGCKLTALKKFDNNIKQNKQNKKKIIIGVYQSDKQIDSASSKDLFYTYIVVLDIKVDFQSRNSNEDSRMEWRQIKLHNQPISIQNYQYDAKRSYLYMIITQKCHTGKLEENQQTSSKIQQFLWVYDMKKQIYVLKHQLKSNTINYHIKYLILEDNNLIYFAGKNYFRQWTVNFCQKSVKQSNVRNVQRALKGKRIVDVVQIIKNDIPIVQRDVFEDKNGKSLFSQDKQMSNINSKLILILSQKQLLLVKSNQLVLQTIPERNMIHKGKQKDNIEKELQNSLNQIYKMKFLFDEYEQMREKQKMIKNRNVQTIVIEKIMFSCISSYWLKDKSICFAIATNKNNVLIYQLNDFQIKLLNQYTYENDSTDNFQTIIANQSGQNLFVINSKNMIYAIDQQLQNVEIQNHSKSLWGNGQMHQKFISVDSPSVQNIMCTVGDQGSLKIWSLKNNERQIIFQELCKQKPLGATIHPCGMLMAVNFQRQIKLYSILPQQFYEITSIKTNYTSFQLKFSTNGQFLVSNQGNALIFYQSFGLKTLGYLQPSDLKFKIMDFKLSNDSQHICFMTEDSSIFFQTIDVGQISKWERITPAHEQSDQYTCIHFDTFSLNQQKQKQSQQNNQSHKHNMNLFIGASKNKYLILYADFGKRLVVEFPIIDCYIVDIQVHQNLLFAATSKGTIRVYHWPILQENCLIQSNNLQNKQIRLKPPTFYQYQVWSQRIAIKKIHKLKFSKQLAVFNDFGNLGLISYQQTKGRKIIYQQIPVQRKKMQQTVNQIFYIKKSQSQKRNKLIQKTQNDILKVQNQILREKIALQRKLQDQQGSIQRNFYLKSHIQEEQKIEYVQNQQQIINCLHSQISVKKQNLQKLKNDINQDYYSKKNYQIIRNQSQETQILKIADQHKKNILKKIQQHKESIKSKKTQYWLKVKEAQNQFEKFIKTQFYEKIMGDKQNLNNTGKKKQMKRLSVVKLKSGNKIKSMQEQLNDQIISQYTSKQSQQLIIQGLRVEQFEKSNTDLQRQIQKFKRKVSIMEQDDQQMQKQFQKYLQDYNSKRFQNLNLHSQVLKMQNQLIERKQILDTKQEVVMLAYQQKQKLQNYRELVKGSLSKMQNKKQNIREVFNKKQHDLNLIFAQLVNEIQKMQKKKTELFKIQRQITLSNKQVLQNQTKIKKTVDHLKEIKKFLLLERMNEEMEQKSNYQYEQNLLTNINFLKKRLFMENIKQKKNKQLKKTSLNQILKQNKNLLEECNQLRSEGIQYENQIKNLSNKLKEANKMISIQSKLKNQKTDVCQQKNQLQVIRELFKMHLKDFDNKQEQIHHEEDLFALQDNKKFNSGNTSYINDQRIDGQRSDNESNSKQFKLSCHKPVVFYDIL